ncbi:MAG: flotillin family protein [Anaerolineae bacterium]|nr:flotillin family protein [Anaerolineae bacterium]
MGAEWLFLGLAFIGIVVALVIFFVGRFKRCPPDHILVIYGNVGGDAAGRRSSRCIHGGAAFVIPIVQDYQYLDLTPITLDIDLVGALSQQNIRIDVPSTFMVGISTEPGVMENAAERLLGLPRDEVRRIAEDIIFGQTRVVIATMEIEEIIANRDKLVDNITNGVEAELKKIGLRLINVNVKDIKDDSDYIESLGREAASRAINEAKKLVAQNNRNGEIGRAEAEQEQRVKVAAANATAVEGENTARVTVANSDAARREKEADAERRGSAAEKVQAAKALEEAYQAERTAEVERAERERATQHADIIVAAEISKERIEIEAEAVAERTRREAKGAADALYAKLEAQARGQRELLIKQAEGLAAIVQAAGGDPGKAALLMVTDKLPELVSTQVEAVKNLRIDKVTVWDSGAANGTPTTARFLSGMMQSLPPLQNLFEMAGMKLPDVLDVREKADAIEPPPPAPVPPPPPVDKDKKA